MAEPKYCEKCDKYPVQKGFRFCCVCKVQVQKEMEQNNYLTKTMFPKIHRSRAAREGSEREE
jgi:hypothetical protein